MGAAALLLAIGLSAAHRSPVRSLRRKPVLLFNLSATDDRMTFRAHAMGQFASGTVDVGENDVRLEVVLPWILQRLAGAVQSSFKKSAQLLLEKRS